MGIGQRNRRSRVGTLLGMCNELRLAPVWVPVRSFQAIVTIAGRVNVLLRSRIMRHEATLRRYSIQRPAEAAAKALLARCSTAAMSISGSLSVSFEGLEISCTD